MPAVVWALGIFAVFGAVAGVAGSFFYCRHVWRDRRSELGQVLVARSDSLKRIDELAGALKRAQEAAARLHASGIAHDPRATAASAEAHRIDADLRHEVRKFLELNRCAERKGASPAVLFPPDAEALLSGDRAAG